MTSVKLPGKRSETLETLLRSKAANVKNEILICGLNHVFNYFEAHVLSSGMTSLPKELGKKKNAENRAQSDWRSFHQNGL